MEVLTLIKSGGVSVGYWSLTSNTFRILNVLQIEVLRLFMFKSQIIGS
jgi:hypothetical protein